MEEAAKTFAETSKDCFWAAPLATLVECLANGCSKQLGCGRRDQLDQEKEDENDHLFHPTVETDVR